LSCFEKVKAKAGSEEASAIAVIRKEESERLTQCSERLNEAHKLQESLSEKVRPLIAKHTEGVFEAQQKAPATSLAGGDHDGELASALQSAAAVATAGINAVREVARNTNNDAPLPAVDPSKETIAPEVAAAMSQEEFEKLNSPEKLSARLSANEKLPADVKDMLTRSLKRPFPEKYRRLLGAFVDACI